MDKKFRTFAISTCAYRQGEGSSITIAHRSALVHLFDDGMAKRYAEYLLNNNYPTSEGWSHVGYSITSPDAVMIWPDVIGNPNN